MGKKLLLADDSITIQKVVGITFAHEDYVLTIVDNGDDALQKAQADRPDLILADVYMPGKNGYELCSAIKQDPSLAGVPVLLLAGTFEPFDEGKAKACGADAWIPKPFESQALIDQVEALLSAAPAAPAPAAPVPAAPAPVAPVPAAPAPVAPAPVAPAPVAPAPVAPAPVAPAPAAEEDDLWGDLAAAEPIVPEPPVEGAWGETAVQEEPPADDLWGDVSFDSEAGEDEAIADDWGDFALDSGAEESAPVEPVAVAPAPVTAALDDFGSAAEEEVMALDESDILEIEELDELEDVAVAESASTAAHDPWGDFGVDETSIETEPLLAVPEGEAEFSFADAAADEPADTTVVADDWGMVVDDEPVSDFGGVADPAAEAVAAEGTEVDAWGNFDLGTATDEEEIFAATPAGEQVFSFDSDETITEPIAPPSAPANVATTAAEEQIAAIGEEQLEVLIEKVAGRVIEQLAGTILEKIAWEVVPDLAESLIKDEMRKLREAAES